MAPTQPQRRIIGRATLAEIGAAVELIAKGTDAPTGRAFYVVRPSPDARPFGVWRDELTDITYCQPVGV